MDLTTSLFFSELHPADSPDTALSLSECSDEGKSLWSLHPGISQQAPLTAQMINEHSTGILLGGLQDGIPLHYSSMQASHERVVYPEFLFSFLCLLGSGLQLNAISPDRFSAVQKQDWPIKRLSLSQQQTPTMFANKVKQSTVRVKCAGEEI